MSEKDWWSEVLDPIEDVLEKTLAETREVEAPLERAPSIDENRERVLLERLRVLEEQAQSTDQHLAEVASQFEDWKNAIQQRNNTS